MSRVAHHDDDQGRLPEGMRRVCYDADTNVYTFRDANGRYWESAPGNQYGKLSRVGQSSAAEQDFRSRNPQFFPPSRDGESVAESDDGSLETMDLEAQASIVKDRACLAILARLWNALMRSWE
ncbi:hypothetical protein ACLX1H_000638 [Fusarium chlamydosporum]